MLAAGWGDMGSVQCDMALEVPMLSQKAMCVDSSGTGLRDIGEDTAVPLTERKKA